MSDVVNGPGGTGQSAQLSYTTLCGKTGTAQWGPPSKNQRLAWFAGFLPADNPRYSFAVLYEGRPGETVSGGRMAAPMVKRFFEGIKDDIKDTIAPPKKALVVVDESEGAAQPAEVVKPEELDPDAEGYIRKPENTSPLKALPVEPLDTGRDDEPADVPEKTVQPGESRAIRALPVRDDEVIEGNVEEP
jgi:penicillin-binding protein 2